MRHGVIKETVNTLMLLSKFLISIFYLSNSSNLQVFQVLIYFKLFETKKNHKTYETFKFRFNKIHFIHEINSLVK